MTSQESCSMDSCGCESTDFHAQLEEKLYGMAFVAHKSVLFDKISKKIEERHGDKLDKIAGLVVDATLDKMKDEHELHRKKEELRKSLKEIFEE